MSPRPVWTPPPSTLPQQHFEDPPPDQPCPNPNLPYLWAGGQWVLLSSGESIVGPLHFEEAYNEGEHRDPRGRWVRGWADSLNLGGFLASPSTDEHAMAARGLDQWPSKGPTAQRVLGDAYDTAELHESQDTPGTASEFRYTPERLEKHEHMVRDLTDHHASQEDPHVLVMAGGPASGKTTFLRRFPHLPVMPHDAVRLDVDDIRRRLPEFQEMAATHDPYAALGTHHESGDILEKALARALQKRENVIVDQVGDGPPGQFVKQLQRLHDAGYKVDVVYKTTPTEEAVRRNVARAEGEERRYVPTPVVRDRHRLVAQRFQDEVSKLPWLNSLTVFDDEGLIGLQGEDGHMVATSAPRYDAWMAKAHEPKQDLSRLRIREAAEREDESVIVDPLPFDLQDREDAARERRKRMGKPEDDS